MTSYIIIFTIVILAYFASKTVLKSVKSGGCVGCNGNCSCGCCCGKKIK